MSGPLPGAQDIPDPLAPQKKPAPASSGPKKKSKAQTRRDGLAAWWDRPCWPCVILSVDPGREAGASIFVSRPGGVTLVDAAEIDTYTTALENMVIQAAEHATLQQLPMVTVLEDWGTGGPRGLSQWIGLGEQRGPWRRAAIMVAADYKMVTKGRIALVAQTRWRSRVIEETGDRSSGEFVRFDADGWKAAAIRAAPDLVLDAYVPTTPNAAESVCMGYYAARSDEVGKLIPKTVLKRFGLTYEPLEPLIAATKPKKKKGGG